MKYMFRSLMSRSHLNALRQGYQHDEMHEDNVKDELEKSPLILSIREVEMRRKFTIPHFKVYDDRTDPEGYL